MEDHGDANREAVRLWRVWKTVRQMCQDRVCASPNTLQTLSRREIS